MNKQLNIFLLIGQSNMYGCGDIAEVRPLKHPQVSMYQGGQWIPASDPLHVDAPDDPRVGLSSILRADGNVRILMNILL